MFTIFIGGTGEDGDWAGDETRKKSKGNIFQCFSSTNLGRKVCGDVKTQG